MISIAIFLALHYPVSRWIARAMVIPAVRAEAPLRFQFSLVDWLTLLVILQVIFALIVPLRDVRAIRMANWIPLTYCLGSVTLCWWASVPELTKGDVQRPIQRFIWLLCLVPLNAMQTLVVAWFGLAFIASVVILVIGGSVAIVSAFPIATTLIVVAMAGILGYRRKTDSAVCGSASQRFKTAGAISEFWDSGKGIATRVSVAVENGNSDRR
jgi:hypothetical protein